MKTTKLPRISVVTPSFNQGQFLEETILSVIGQNYPNLEYIIIDGGSSDNSVDIIKKYEKHFAFWVSEKDKGQSHAINKGFAKATGDILCWLNSDDLFLPSTFSYIISLPFSLDKPFILYGNCMHFEESAQGLVSWGSDVVNASNSTLLEHQDYLTQPSTFWTKSTWQLVGPLREDSYYAFDWEWFLRARKLNIKFHAVNKGLSLYRIHPAHKTANGGNTRRDEILAIYEQYSARYAKLYKMIREEDLDFSSFSKRVIKRTLKFFKKPTSKGSLLKQLKYRKYRGYTYQELDKSISML